MRTAWTTDFLQSKPKADTAFVRKVGVALEDLSSNFSGNTLMLCNYPGLWLAGGGLARSEVPFDPTGRTDGVAG